MQARSNGEYLLSALVVIKFGESGRARGFRATRNVHTRYEINNKCRICNIRITPFYFIFLSITLELISAHTTHLFAFYLTGLD